MKTKPNKIFSRNFESIFEVYEFITANRKLLDNDPNGYIHMFDSSMSFDAALAIAKDGGRFESGARDIQPIDIDLSSLDVHGMDTPRPESAVIGYRPNVAAFLAGSPQSMWSMPPQVEPNKLVRVAVNTGLSSGVSARAITARGNGILAVLNALDAAGLSIEIWACSHATTFVNGMRYEMQHDVLVKRADAPYSPDSIAFTLVNADYQRRLMFGLDVIEHNLDPKNDTAKNIYNNSLGGPDNCTFHDYDLVYDFVLASDRWTKDNAVNKARGIAESQLNEARAA